jgi:serine/threonine protein kinase
MPNASRDAIDIMEWMLEFNPKKRPDCNQIMKHQFFTSHISQYEI